MTIAHAVAFITPQLAGKISVGEIPAARHPEIRCSEGFSKANPLILLAAQNFPAVIHCYSL